MTAVLQTYLEVEQRGRVLAIWFMSFGGVVPIGTLIFAPLVDAYGARWLMVLGACVAVFLTFWCDLIALERVKEAR
jgi:sugar phosphate permease